MKEILNYFLIGCFVSALLYFAIKSIVEFLNAVTETINESIFLKLKSWVDSAINYLKTLKNSLYSSTLNKTTIPLVVMFSVGVSFMVVNFYLVRMAMVLIIPPIVEDVAGIPVNSYVALAWLLLEVIIGVYAIEIYFSLNLIPGKFVKKVRKTKSLKYAITSLMIALLLCSSVLTYMRCVKASSLYGTQSNYIGSIILSFVSFILPLMSMVTISMGFRPFLGIVMILMYFLVLGILGLLSGSLAIMADVVKLIGSVIGKILWLASEPISLLLKRTSRKSISGNNKETVTKVIKETLPLVLIALTLMTGCSPEKRDKSNVSLCIVLDLSGSFQDYIDKAKADIEQKILPFLDSGDDITILAIADNSFDDNKAVIFSAELPVMQNWADDLSVKSIKGIKEECIKSLECVVNRIVYRKTDIYRALFYAGYVLKNKKRENRKILVVFSDMEDNVKTNDELPELKNIKVVVLYVSHKEDEDKFMEKVQLWREKIEKAGASGVEIYDPLLSNTAKLLW